MGRARLLRRVPDGRSGESRGIRRHGRRRAIGALAGGGRRHWTDPGDTDDTVAWVRQAWRDLGPFGTGGAYLNFSGDADERADAPADRVRTANLGSLAEVKAKYDPDNFFRRNDNIQPASGALGDRPPPAR